LREPATQFLNIKPGSEDAAVLALVKTNYDELAARKLGIDADEIATLRKAINEAQGDLVIMFGAELSAASQAVVAQLPYLLAGEGRRILLHPLPLFNNSIGAHDINPDAKDLNELLENTGGTIRGAYIAGSLLPSQRVDALGRLDFLAVQELFETDTTAFADVVLPAASFAEVDGTYTNNDGFVQRVRKSIEPVHQSKPDWLIVSQLAKELGVDFGFEMSASAVFRELSELTPAYADLRYPSLKDETQPVQVKHAISPKRDLSNEVAAIRR